MSQFSIAGLQLEASNQNNLYAIQNEIEAALRRFPWLDMVVVGELATYGSNPQTAQPAGGEAEQAYCELAAKHGIWLQPGSLFEQCDGKIYNTAPVINPQGEIVASYRKMFPFVPYEASTTSGDGFVVFDVPDKGRIGLCICYDIWFPEVARTLAWMGAELILCPTMTNTIDRDVELCLARSTAAVNQCYVMSLNVAGRLGVGQSITVDPNGTVMHQAGGNQELISFDVDFEQVRRSRDRGVLGLGQTLKSFRDCGVEFPPYLPAARSESLDALGPIKMPDKGGDEGAF
jgi:deaminated glutathione amidase